uniref:DNA-directed RNA polymerase I subunit RPA49 n=1 Tax=Strongyloides venezuelensis TaxID=75913 RepID=A0A0K0FB42_STRVS
MHIVSSSEIDSDCRQYSPRKCFIDDSSEDVVVTLNGRRLKKGTSATYKKITFDDGSVSYALNDEENTSKCINFGNVEKNDKIEYFVAYVNKRTKDVTYKQARLVKLRPQIVENKEKFFNGKVDKEAKPDYTKTNGIEKNEFLGKRNALTRDFGSIKKRKMLNDIDRRNVDHDTMVALADTAFASNTNIEEKPNLNESGVDALAAIDGSTQGDIAPKYNKDGKKPLEIWPIEQFLEDSTYDIVSGQCSEFFQDKSFDDLIELGFPRLIAELANSYVADGKIERRLYLVMKLHYMIILHASCRSYRVIDLKNIPYGNIPEVLAAQVNSEFFDVSNTNKNGKVPFTVATTDKLISHILILYMLLNEPKHCIYINIASKQFLISELKMTRCLTKLGCVINKPTNDEEINYAATRVGVIKNAPGLRTFGLKRKR